MAEEKKKKSDKLYGDSPSVKRGKDGEVGISKPSDGNVENKAGDGQPIVSKEHDEERASMHKRHEEEQKSMHERHSKDMKEMHKRHEKSGEKEPAPAEEIKKDEK